ncbi:hypothetical protein Tco_1387261 [Tanacetum coccineum]
MVEPFNDSTINDWSGTLYAVGGIPDSNMMIDVPVGNMPDDEVVPDLNLDIHIPAINIDVVPTDGHAALKEIISNLGLAIWSENQALMGANEELRDLVREMRIRESVAEHLCDDLQDVILARDNQISAYMNEINQLHYEQRRMLSEISVLEEEVSRLCCGQSSHRRR